MAEIQNTKRITYKHSQPNPLFQSWLEELYDEAKAKSSKLEGMLMVALESMSKYPLPLNTGADCAILKGFDKRLCRFMDMRLDVYKENSQLHVSFNSSTDGEPLNSNVASAVENQPTPVASTSKGRKKKVPKPPKPPNQKKEYKPAHRSGGYAILITLLNNMKDNPQKPFLTKEELIERAQEHSEESFTRPKPYTYYTAWSTMPKLVTKGLVDRVRSKKAAFALSSSGVALATELLSDSQNIPSVNDLIFNDTSFGSYSQNSNSEETEVAKTVDVPAITVDTVSKAVSVPKATVSIPKTTATEAIVAVAETEDVEIDENVIEMRSGDFDVILLIDKMETSGLSKKNDPTVAQFKKFPDLKHEYRHLKVGDFTWVARSKNNPDQEFVLPYIVERKRMDDLGHSVKDGRFHEQKFRLRRCGLKNVIYLVEHFGKNQHVGLPLQSLMQALANTRVQDGFFVHVTDSLTYTARFLAMMTKRLTLEYKDKTLKGRNGEVKTGELMTFSYFNKSSAKTKTLTVTETFIKILLQLKGMSVEKALAITNAYKTPKSLLVKYQKVSQKEGEMLLANLKYSDLSRQVGPVASRAIYQLFTINNLQ